MGRYQMSEDGTWVDHYLYRKRHFKFRRSVQLAKLEALVYFIWRNKNEALWNFKVGSIDSTIRRIQNIVNQRVYSWLLRKISDDDRRWFKKL